MQDGLFSLAKCFKLWLRLWDAARFWGFGCRLRGVVLGCILPGPAVTFALGLYDVTAQSSSLVDNGAEDV